MAKGNTLSDDEVSLIKGLLGTHQYSKQEIAGLINRSRGGAASDISSGRITNIEKGEIAKYKDVLAASEEKVRAFIELWGSVEPSNRSPIHPSVLAKILPIKLHDPLTLNITETEIIECKKSLNVPIKTIAAFANNKGGYLVFGVENGTWRVDGLQGDKFEKYDLNKLNQSIRDCLGINIEISRELYEIEGKKIGIFYIAPAHTKPVILIHNADGMSQGQIYYRYPGEDRLIAPPDLQMILENRIRQLSETVLSKHIANILRFGLDNSAVLNVATGEVDGKAGSFLIDEALLPKISFVREGEFVEKSGAPALKVVGDVAVTKAVVAYTDREVIDKYPYTYREMLSEVKKVTGAKESDVQRIMRQMKIKSDKAYSHYNFGTLKDRDRYCKTGSVKPNTRSLYNGDAIAEISKRLESTKLTGQLS